MQAQAWVVNDLVNPSAVKAMQIGFEIGTDLVRRGPALTRSQRVVLMDLGLFQGKQLFFWMGQTGCGQTPCPDGGTHQVDGLITARQPMTE